MHNIFNFVPDHLEHGSSASMPVNLVRPRVAYFPDSFHEINGVAHTSRKFAEYAERHRLPFLSVRASLQGRGPRQLSITSGNGRALELRRSPLAIRMEKDLHFDPLFFRHAPDIDAQLRAFRPDVIHITGPSELGMFGAWFAWRHKLPLAASWHTNVHEYAGRRLAWLTRMLPLNTRARLERTVEDASLAAALRFYAFADVLFAPNQELCGMLARSTAKRCHLMQRGVDTALFTPTLRTRSLPGSAPPKGAPFVLGYVGRFSIEKNVALLVRIERELLAQGISNVRFVLVGHGREQQMLRRELRTAEFTGVLGGQALARAYANMDLLVFPSHTDTFGNVVLEAMASGVPAVVTPDGGPKFIVRDGETGFVAPDHGFAPAVASLIRDPARLARMRLQARAHASTCSWDAVFNGVYSAYPHPDPIRSTA